MSQIGAHVEGHNVGSIGVAYVGGLTADGRHATDTRTQAQKEGLRALLFDLIQKFPTIRAIKGHRDYSPDLDRDGHIEPNEWVKQCPCFDAIPEYRDIVEYVNGRPYVPYHPTVNRTLRAGSRGADVATLQHKLLALAYTLGPSGADGIFGSNTFHAVWSFQADRGLNTDGVVGPVTREALCI